jgi:hypothetical protein
VIISPSLSLSDPYPFLGEAELARLQRQYRIAEGDRKAYSDESQSTLRKQVCSLISLSSVSVALRHPSTALRHSTQTLTHTHTPTLSA